MTNIMLDLETMSLASNAAIITIGAVEFDERSIGRTFYERINPELALADGLDSDPETLAWWERQDRKVRAEAFGGTKSLRQVLLEFTAWMPDDAVVWGNGAASDNVWLANAYVAADLPKPWDYRNDRCYRTMLAIFPVKRVKPKKAHHALHDAKAQAKTLIKLSREYNI